MRRARRTWGQRLLIACNCFLVVVCLVSAAVLVYAERSVSDVPRLSLGDALATDKPSSQPQNILVVGIDSTNGLDADDPILNGRTTSFNTDTIMILRVDPASDQVSLLSLPRDLWVDIGDHGSKDRINTAYAAGGPDGPQNLIATINKNFQIEIDHYAEINLAGFRDLVAAIDGVPLYFPWAVRDSNVDIGVDEPGCVTLTPDQALDFSRARHLEKFEDGRWISDPQSDLSRIQRQQAFIKAALKRAIDKGVRNPFTLNRLINVGTRSVTLDDSFTTRQIIDLGLELRDFDPDSLVLYSPPVVRYITSGGADVLQLDGSGAQAIFDVFRGKDDLKGTTWIEVRNGTGVAGQGQQVLDQYGALGFVAMRATDSTDFAGSETVVLYQPGQRDKAVEAARYIDGPLGFQEDAGLTEVNVAVVTGNGFNGIRTEPVDAASLEALLPTTTVVVDPGDPDVAEEPATIEPNQFVPATPPGITCG